MFKGYSHFCPVGFNKILSNSFIHTINYPDSKVHGANMGPTWVLSSPVGLHVGPMNLAIVKQILRNIRQHMYRWALIIEAEWCITIIGLDDGLSPGRPQAIIWTNAGILLIGPLGTNLEEIVIKIHNLSFTKMLVKISSAKWRPFCQGEMSQYSCQSLSRTICMQDVHRIRCSLHDCSSQG